MKKLLLLFAGSAFLATQSCTKKAEPDPIATAPAPPTILVSMNGGASSKLTNAVVKDFTLGGTAGPTGIHSLDLYGGLGGNLNLEIMYYTSPVQPGSPVSVPLGKVILYKGTTPIESISVAGGATNRASDNDAPNTTRGVFQSRLSDGTEINGSFLEAWTKK